MRKYINRNYPDFTAEQRADGNYNLKKEGSYGYTIRIAKDIENNEDWVEESNWYLEALKEFNESWREECERIENAIWGSGNKPSDKYEGFFKTVLDNVDSVKDAHTTDYMYVSTEKCLRYHENRACPPAEKPKEKKPDEILSVRVGGKKYKLKDPHKNSKIHSFFTNGSDIWVSLFCGEQYKL